MSSAMTYYRGKSVIVTGGASGIGRALGAELLRSGAHVVLADIDGDEAGRVAVDVRDAAGTTVGSVVAATLDVRDADAVRALVEEVANRHGGLDLLFNNAGISLGGPSHEMTQQHWDRIIDINLRGVVNGVVAAYPLMVARGSGHIVNTTSPAGLVSSPLTVPYSTTKHAVSGLTTCLRPEAARLGVRVTLLCPGSIDTPIQDKREPADLPRRASDVMTGREFLQAVGGTRLMQVDAFAARALRGIARNRAVVIVPASIKPLWYLQRLSPRLTELVSSLIVRRGMREVERRKAAGVGSR